jgi:hypothetical protein
MTNFGQRGFAMLTPLGERTDLRACFDSRDNHFDCLDKFDDVIGEQLKFNLPR